jgi:diguanylate cyclase (GGDEF)-like protein/PAS domain S-box-containing protein
MEMAKANKNNINANPYNNKVTSNLYTENILIVDDEVNHLNSLNELIKKENYNIKLANSADEANNVLDSNPIDLILLDMNMPQKGGVEVMKHISSNKMDTTVIVVSGESTFEAAENALKYGAYDYVRKPYSIDGLLNSLKNAFKKRHLEYENNMMQYRLLKSEILHRYIVNKSPDIVYMLNSKGVFTFVNERMEKTLGYDKNDVVGKHYSSIIHDDDLEMAKYTFNERRTGKRASANVELRLKCKDNAQDPRSFDTLLLPTSINSFGLYKTKNGNEKFIGTYGIARDVTEKKKSEKIIHFQAYHDNLTRLPNRILLKDRLVQAMSYAKRNKNKLSVMFLDLDRFKNINDTLGHMVGDKLLQAVAKRLKKCLREGDTLARIGGDEFTVLLPEIHGQHDSELIAQKIINTLKTPFNLVEHEIFVSTSIGIAQYPDDGENIESLLKHADIAMYAIKNKGKDGYQFYTSSMHEEVSAHLSLENDLRRAIPNDQFRLHYQPQVDAVTHKIIAVEALIRWDHPERGTIMPSEFISFCEETGLIQSIGDWILESVCADLSVWNDMDMDIPRVAVNISAKQFEQADFIEKIKTTLKKYNITGDMLELEITENVIMDEIENVISILNQLSSMGIKIAIDDFGIGYSSLNYLQKLPIDTLKIDRSFVSSMEFDDGAKSIIQAIIAMAKGLKLHIISEGVEELGQMEKLKALGCYNMQGFLFSPPVSKESVTDLLVNNNGRVLM